MTINDIIRNKFYKQQNFYYLDNYQQYINQIIMKNFLFFLFSCLISATALLLSGKIAEIELGISTVICIWIIFAWSVINKVGQGKEDSRS